MKNKKYWLVAKGVLLLLFVTSVLVNPSRDTTQLVWRTFILIFLAITFFYDWYDLKKGR